MEQKSSLLKRFLKAPKEKSEGAQIGSLDPVAVVQNAMSNPSKRGLASLSDAFDDIVRQELWQRSATAEGAPYESFGAFATAALPCGLGICSREAASLARHVLLQADRYAEWTEILERIARGPGRPKKIANGAGFRFYPLSRAPHATDRLLLLLKAGHLDHFHAVCNGECTPYRAAINAGAVCIVGQSMGEKPLLRFGVCDFQRASLLRPKVQQRLLREIFRLMPLDAQCGLIANELEPKLRPGLAKKWRSSSVRDSSGS